MKTFYIILLMLALSLSAISCSYMSSELDINTIDSMTVYNCDYDSLHCGICIDDTFGVSVTGKSQAQLLITSYINNSIVFLSPHSDTVRFAGNNNVTGIQNTGIYRYFTAPEEGYFNFDYPVNNNYYFIKYEVNADSAIYGRLFINYYSADSINFNIEISKEGKIFEKSN